MVQAIDKALETLEPIFLVVQGELYTTELSAETSFMTAMALQEYNYEVQTLKFIEKGGVIEE